jgi:hypothetical protein
MSAYCSSLERNRGSSQFIKGGRKQELIQKVSEVELMINSWVLWNVWNVRAVKVNACKGNETLFGVHVLSLSLVSAEKKLLLFALKIEWKKWEF